MITEGTRPVSIHICVGNVSGHGCKNFSINPFRFIYARGMFSFALGIGRWSTRWFQLIYARGMFLKAFCIWRHDADVSTHICAGNVLCGEGTDGWPRKFQFIYVREMFI